MFSQMSVCPRGEVHVSSGDHSDEERAMSMLGGVLQGVGISGRGEYVQG